MTKKRNLLVVVNMQNDYISSQYASELAKTVVQPVIERVKQAFKNNEYVIFIMDSYNNMNINNNSENINTSLLHCIYGNDGKEMISELKDLIDKQVNYTDYCIITKESFGVDPTNIKTFLDTGSWDSVELIGVNTDTSVLANAINFKSISRGSIKVKINEKCCAGTSKKYHNKAIDILKNLDIKII